MPRPRTATKPLDLRKLADGVPRTRRQLGATHYALQLAEQNKLITPGGKLVNATLWKLTPKGKRRVKALA